MVQKVGNEPQGNTVKAETVAMPNFSNAPIADEYAIFDTNYGQFKVRLLGLNHRLQLRILII